MNSPIILFIIPTINRSTLKNTIESLMNQTCPEWNAFVLFDGIEKNEILIDPRINYRSIEKKGRGVNQAGEVRNIGFNIVIEEKIEIPWIGFVDDDDTLSPYYIEYLKEEIQKENSDAVLFRMKREEDIFPPIHCKKIEMCQVGISFALHRRVIEQGIRFQSSGVEDYFLLNRLYENYFKIYFSSKVAYFVKENASTEKIDIGVEFSIQKEKKPEDFLFHLLSLSTIYHYYHKF